jgi:hypothetical protein
MKYEEEISARDLYKILTQEFADSSSETKTSIDEISFEGAIIGWVCTAVRGKRCCSIEPMTTEYFVSFDEEDQTQAMGRTLFKREAVSAMNYWLEGHDLNELYEAFEFIDRRKRYLERFWDKAVREYPELDRCATIKLDEEHGDFYYLWFITKDRSCRLYFFCQNQFPTCEFYWDECQLFEVLAEDSIPSPLILKRWLCDQAIPSALEQEFPWLDTGRLAKHYEEGRGIEGEFILSWDSTEEFYDERISIPQCPEILNMIAQMRERGYDRTLRAGHSMYTFIVSKSRRHRLEKGQPRLMFDFQDNAMDVIYLEADSEEKFSCPKIEYTSQINDLMRRLEAKDID